MFVLESEPSPLFLFILSRRCVCVCESVCALKNGTLSRCHLSISAEVWCMASSETLIAFTSPCCLCARMSPCVCACSWHAWTDRSIFITNTDWGWCAPPLGGGAPGLLANRAMLAFDWVVLMSQRRSALQHWYTDYVFASSESAPDSPLHPPTSHVIDLFFNAQTNGSLIIPGYFLGSLLRNPLKRNSNVKWAGERTLFAQ